MAYDPYTAVNEIYKLKGQWETGNNNNDDKMKNNAATSAQTYYQELRDNGYSDIADKLTAADYNQAKGILDNVGTMGKTKVRQHFYNRGKADGLSQSDIDALIGFNDVTGSVSFAGKDIGRPDIIVDGTSYVSDTSGLDSVYDDYMENSGAVPSSVTDKVNKVFGIQTSDHDDLVGMYKDEIDTLKKTNPFTTAEAKAIMGKYDLSGLQARDNAAAVGAASNGGNIDSYAAANAMRQQASLVNQGQQVVLDAHQQKLDHAKGLLSDLGIQMRDNYSSMRDTITLQQSEEQRQFDNKKTISDVTGYVPDEWVVSNNPYMNEDGTIKDIYKNDDFSDIMAKAKEAGNDELYNYAAQARFYKIMGDYGAYGQYDDGNYAVPGQMRTAAVELEKEGMKSAETIAEASNKSQEKIAQTNANAAVSQSQIAANAQTSAANIQANADKYGYDAAAKAQNAEAINSASAVAELNTLVTTLDPAPKKYVLNVLAVEYPKWVEAYGGKVPEQKVIDSILENTKEYNIDVAEARNICRVLGVDESWLDNYEDGTGEDKYNGMVKKA